MRIGYLGVGQMGQPMAGRLLDGGHEVWVYDVREEALRPLLERQARRAASPRALADACEVVVVSLPTLEVFRAAVTGPDGLLAGNVLKTLVNTCTVGAAFISDIAAACAERGVIVVDAPISGGPAGAAAGTLAVMASGNRDEIERLRPVMQLWGKTFVVAGDTPGAAQVMKLTNNILFAVSLVATCEAMAMANKAGIEPRAMLEVLNNGTGRNFTTQAVYPNNILPGTFDFGATCEILMKDVDLAISQGEELGIPMWVCQAARLAFLHGTFKGRLQQDLSRVAEMIEEGVSR